MSYSNVGPRFRWAVCQLDALSSCITRSMLRKSLSKLPATLYGTYERILGAISDEYSSLVLRILRWLAFSSRPLLLEEIAEVIAIDTEREPAFNEDDVLEDPFDVLKLCSSLINISSRDWLDGTVCSEPDVKIVCLSHYSVKEYLVSDRIHHGPAKFYSLQDNLCHRYIAECCIKYLRFKTASPLTVDTTDFSLLIRYSAQHWINHVRSMTKTDKALTELIVEFLTVHTDAYLNWARIFDVDCPLNDPDIRKTAEKVPSPLYVASISGLTEISEHLIDFVGADVHARGGMYGYALLAAAAEGHQKVVELLLSKGADINTYAQESGTALQAASSRGHVRLVELLLTKGADVNMKPGRLYGRALREAASRGNESIVRMLLSKGAKTNSEGRYVPELQSASSYGYIKIVELLLANGADPNRIDDRKSGTALQVASSRGHEGIVELLWANGADVNGPPGSALGTALQAASKQGHERIVKMLLKKGADVNAQTKSHSAALQEASAGGYEELVELLLRHGADIDAQSGQKSHTALQTAYEEGHITVFNLLLRRGAKISLWEGELPTELRGRDKNGHALIIRPQEVQDTGFTNDHVETELSSLSKSLRHQISESLPNMIVNVSGHWSILIENNCAAQVDCEFPPSTDWTHI